MNIDICKKCLYKTGSCSNLNGPEIILYNNYFVFLSDDSPIPIVELGKICFDGVAYYILCSKKINKNADFESLGHIISKRGFSSRSRKKFIEIIRSIEIIDDTCPYRLEHQIYDWSVNNEQDTL